MRIPNRAFKYERVVISSWKSSKKYNLQNVDGWIRLASEQYSKAILRCWDRRVEGYLPTADSQMGQDQVDTSKKKERWTRTREADIEKTGITLNWELHLMYIHSTLEVEHPKTLRRSLLIFTFSYRIYITYHYSFMFWTLYEVINNE